jgi:sugar lactone lactonase YvrE
MRYAWRTIAALLAIGVVAAGGSVALADDGGGHGDRNGNGDGDALATTIFTMPAAPDGNPEGIAFDRSSGRFFVSRTATGAIFAGTLDSPALTPFIPGTTPGAGPLATGLKVRDGLLYVAGATTGEVRVYRLDDPTAAPIVFQTGGGFINDLDVTENGDVYATDSTKSFLYKIPAAAVRAGGGAVEPIDLSASITSDPAAFNLNGIVASRDGDELIVVQSNVGKLFRITFRDSGAPRVQEIEIQGGDGNVNGGDGLLLERGRLLVVRGSTPQHPNGAVQVFKLRRHHTRARFESETSDPSLSGPSTIARARDVLLVVNASFAAGPTADGTFTVTGLSRDTVRHGDDGDDDHGGRHDDD